MMQLEPESQNDKESRILNITPDKLVYSKEAQYWSNSFIPKCIFTIDSLCKSFLLVNFIFQQEIIKKDI